MGRNKKPPRKRMTIEMDELMYNRLRLKFGREVHKKIIEFCKKLDSE